MSQSYHAQHRRTMNKDSSHLEVSSSLCTYQVFLANEHILLVGPGVSEDLEGHTFPHFESKEDFAIYLVILWENGLWPED